MAVPEIDEPKLPMTVDSPIIWAEYLIDHKALRAYYDKHDIKCFNCCAAEAETFAQGSRVHQGGPHGTFDAEQVVADLNALAKKHPLDPDKLEKPSILRSIAGTLFPG